MFMKTLKRHILTQSSPERVFEVLDDLGVTGMHMTNASAIMMGSKLHLQYLTTNHTGLNSKYRWTGKMMGIKMEFTVAVTKWVKGGGESMGNYRQCENDNLFVVPDATGDLSS